MVAVCSVSYASYLLQRYVAPASAGLADRGAGRVLFLHGDHCRAGAAGPGRGDGHEANADRDRAGHEHHVSATAHRHRIFQPDAGVRCRAGHAGSGARGPCPVAPCFTGSVQGDNRKQPPSIAHGNPLELGAAAIFAALFIAVSLVSSWAVQQFGTAGIYALAVIVGVSDIDPFVLSLAQNGAGQVSPHVGVVAILLATSSNNLLKATYAMAYSGGNRLIWPVAALVLLAACGIGVAVTLA